MTDMGGGGKVLVPVLGAIPITVSIPTRNTIFRAFPNLERFISPVLYVLRIVTVLLCSRLCYLLVEIRSFLFFTICSMIACHQIFESALFLDRLS